jgi:radical SAM protein with 4Fe4S-binding SPASM domain
MHQFEAIEPSAATSCDFPVNRGLDFLWLELTNRCNLQCVHCYTESHANSGDRDVLTKQDYESILIQAYDVGCRQVQFIGGEPQLNRDLKSLLRTARETGYEFIEVFSNLTFLDDETLGYSADNQVCFATSVYSDDSRIHDAITKVRSSHARTVGNLKKLVANGIVTRAATIVIDQDAEAVERTQRFLEELGVGSVRVSEVREFGRGEQLLSQSAQLSGLCGHCWRGKLAIAPDGVVYPCVMARQWPVGNIVDTALSQIVESDALQDIRRAIFEAAWLPRVMAACHPACAESCGPDLRTCSPNDCPMSCNPLGCMPAYCSPLLPK